MWSFGQSSSLATQFLFAACIWSTFDWNLVAITAFPWSIFQYYHSSVVQFNVLQLYITALKIKTWPHYPHIHSKLSERKTSRRAWPYVSLRFHSSTSCNGRLIGYQIPLDLPPGGARILAEDLFGMLSSIWAPGGAGHVNVCIGSAVNNKEIFPPCSAQSYILEVWHRFFIQIYSGRSEQCSIFDWLTSKGWSKPQLNLNW